MSANADKDANAPPNPQSGGGGGAGWRRAKPAADETNERVTDATSVPSGATPVPAPTEGAPDMPASLDATFVSDSKVARGTGGVGDGTIVQPSQMPTSPIDEASKGPQPVGDRTLVTPARATPASMPTERATHDVPDIQGIEIVREIARGGMGVVFEGHQAFLDRRVAVKILLSEGQGSDFTKRFRREAKILASLSHSNVVACYQADVAPDGRCYLVMEYIDGPTLAGYIEKKGPLAARDALRTCRATASALAYAHRSGIIHRDVKPANVLLKTPQHVKPGDTFPFEPMLADLGLARASGDAAPKVTVEGLTMQGQVMGSPPTMAPEQFDAPDSVDFRTDVYGLGCVLFHCLTGRLAFPQSTLTKLIAVKSQTPPPDPRELAKGVPADVALLVRDMLAPRAEDRPASYDVLLDRFDALLAAKSSVRTTSNKASSKAPLAALGVLLVGAAAWGATTLFGDEPRAKTNDDTDDATDVVVVEPPPVDERDEASDGTQANGDAAGDAPGDTSGDVDVATEPDVVPVVDPEPPGPLLVLPTLQPPAAGQEQQLFGDAAHYLASWRIVEGETAFWGGNPDVTHGALLENKEFAAIEHDLCAPSWSLVGYFEPANVKRIATDEVAIVIVLGEGRGIELRQAVQENEVRFGAAIVELSGSGRYELLQSLPDLELPSVPRDEYRENGPLAFRVDWDGRTLAVGCAFEPVPENIEKELALAPLRRMEWTVEELVALELGAPVRLRAELARGTAKFGRFVVTGR